MLAAYSDPAAVDVFERVAGLSGLFEVAYAEGSSARGEPSFNGYLRMQPASFNREGVALGVNLALEIHHADDVLALRDLLGDYVRFDQQVREGAYEGPDRLRLQTQGKLFGFGATVLPSMSGVCEDTVYDFDETLINHIEIGVMTGDGLIVVASLSPYKGRHSALCLEHDLCVIAALIEGMPLDQVEQNFMLKKKRLLKQAYDLKMTMHDGRLHVTRAPRADA